MKAKTLEKESVDWVDNDRHSLFHHADFRAYGYVLFHSRRIIICENRKSEKGTSLSGEVHQRQLALTSSNQLVKA
jgi:hypothetical protein